MSEATLSKYAEKHRRKMLAVQRATAAIDLAVRITEGTAKPKPSHPVPPPEPRGQTADLGDRPARLAALLDAANQKLREAETLCSEIYAMSKPGIQRAEPLAIYQFVAATADRVISMVPRASRIRNKPQKKEGEEC